LGDVPTAEVVKPRLSVIEDPAEALKSEEVSASGNERNSRLIANDE